MVSMLKKYISLLRFDSFNDNKKRIDAENRMGIALILLYYTTIEVLNLVVILYANNGYLHSRSISVDLIFVLIAVPLFLLIRRKKNINYTLLIYLVEIPILLITIWHGTFEDPHGLTITFLLCLVVLPELIMDKPYRIILLTVTMTGIYALLDIVAKSPDIYVKDLLHVTNACLISISVSLYVMAVRIQNNNFINIAEDKAERDSLTGLYNRYGAQKHFKKNEPGLLMFMDLDRFKEVNDLLGHGEGDRVLQATAQALQSHFREKDLLIRLGGDEFAVFAPGVWTKEAIQNKLTETLRSVDSIHLTHRAQRVDIDMTASIGCAYAPNGADEIDTLIRAADEAMYKVKRTGKNNFAVVVLDDKKNANA